MISLTLAALMILCLFSGCGGSGNDNKQGSAAADDRIDIFLVEADYALKYIYLPNLIM